MSLQPSLPVGSTEQAVASSANGESHPKPSRLPQSRRGRSHGRFLIPGIIIALLAIGGTVWGVWFRGPQARTDLVTSKVEYRDLQLKVTERGTLEAKEPREMKGDVKAGSRGAPKIKW